MRISLNSMKPLWLSLAGFLILFSRAAAQDKPRAESASRGDLGSTLVERGTVQAATAADVVCLLPGRGKEDLTSTIRWLAEDGVMVKKGDKIAQLDDSSLKEALQNQVTVLARQQALFADVQAEIKFRRLGVQRVILSKETALELTEAELKAFRQDLALQRRKLELKVKQGELATALAREQAGKKPTPDKQLAVQMADLEQEINAVELKRLAQGEDLQIKRMEARIKERRWDLEMSRLQGERRLQEGETQLLAAKAAVELEKARLEALQANMKHCTMTAPIDGLLVYYLPESSRGSTGQPVLAMGKPVREGQKMFRIYDLSRFQVEVRVQEAQVARVRPGMRTRVRVDAFPNRPLAGQVATVSSVPLQRDWVQRNVKVYPVIVSLSDQSPGLKPGMTAEVTLMVREGKPGSEAPAHRP